MPSTSSHDNQEWEQEAIDSEEMNPQLGSPNPTDNGETDTDLVGSTMVDPQQTLVVFNAPGHTDFSIASLPKTTITEMSFKESKKREHVPFVWAQATVLSIVTGKASSHVNTAKQKVFQDTTHIM